MYAYALYVYAWTTKYYTGACYVIIVVVIIITRTRRTYGASGLAMDYYYYVLLYTPATLFRTLNRDVTGVF